MIAAALTVLSALSFGMPSPATSVAGVEVPASGALCLRATRQAGYAAVLLPLGTPPKVRTLLLKFEVHDADQKSASGVASDTEPLAAHLISPSILQSASLYCSEGPDASNCTDVAYLSPRPGREVRGRRVRFGQEQYSLAPYRAEYYTAYSLGLDGVLYLRGGARYWLTDTHICASALREGASDSSAEEHTELQFGVEGNSALSASLDHLGERASRAEYTSVPAAQELNVEKGSCSALYDDANASTTASFFPTAAAAEQTWLALESSSAFRGVPDATQQRRRAVELGVRCARAAAKTEDEARALALYRTDCEALSSCRDSPSVPFRRFSTTRMLLDVHRNGTADLRTEKSPTLQKSVSLGETEDSHSLLMAATSFVLIVVAALVTSVRSERSDLESSALFCASVRRAFCMSGESLGLLTKTSCSFPKQQNEGEAQLVPEAAHDEFVAVLAIAARVVTASLSFGPLVADGFARLFWSEAAACAASALHYLMRFCVMCRDEKGEKPITKLGGPTAMIDATASVMLSFCGTPLFAPSGTRFEPTARLLVAILISVEVLPRCIFAAASCGVRLGECCSSNWRYQILLCLAGLQWCVQISCATILLLDAVCAPAALEFGRTTPVPVYQLQTTAFLLVVSAGLPRLTSNAKSLLSRDE